MTIRCDYAICDESEMETKNLLKSTKKWIPSVRQAKFINSLIYGEKPGNVTAAAEAAGVHRTNPYKHWFTKPEFLMYLRAKRDEYVLGWGPIVDRSLLLKAGKGDVSAMRLFYERFDSMIQKYEGKLEIEGETSLTIIYPDGTATTPKEEKEKDLADSKTVQP